MRRVVTIRVLYGRRMVEDDGYPGLRFAYPGLYASPAGSASHVIAIVVGVGNTSLRYASTLFDYVAER